MSRSEDTSRMNGMLRLRGKLARINSELVKEGHMEVADLTSRWGSWVHEEIAAMDEEKRG